VLARLGAAAREPALDALLPPEATGWAAATTGTTTGERARVMRGNLREAAGNDPDCWAWAVEALVAHETRAEIGTITAPALLVWGAEDAGVPVAWARPLAEALGGAPVVVLEDAGHVCNLEQPEAFDRAITEFFAAHPPA
jgi:3-oxoadipate enol-lactonase